MSTLNNSINKLHSLAQSSQWSASLFLPSNHFCVDRNNKVCCKLDLDPVSIPIDVTQILKQLQVEIDVIMMSQVKLILNYPHNAAFEIIGCDGLENADRVISIIKQSALKSGTSLVIRRCMGTIDKT